MTHHAALVSLLDAADGNKPDSCFLSSARPAFAFNLMEMHRLFKIWQRLTVRKGSAFIWQKTSLHPASSLESVLSEISYGVLEVVLLVIHVSFGCRARG